MRTRRSIIFYVWLGLSVQFVLLALVIVFVLAGASYQTSAIKALHERVQTMQLLNLTMQTEYLDAQRALRGYQATGEGRFLQTFYGDQEGFGLSLRQLRQDAWPGVLSGVAAQARVARASFVVADQAVAYPRNGALADRLYNRVSAISDDFAGVTDGLQRQLAQTSDGFADSAERTLGVGLAGTSAVLGFGLMLPVALWALGLRWMARPLHAATRVVRSHALGDYTSRAVPGGPSDVRELATSINFLTDESSRLRWIEEERLRLQIGVHQASIRIRQHLHADAIIREALLAVREHLGADSVWVGLADGEKGLDQENRGTVAGIAGILPRDSVDWLMDIYQRRASYCVQDLRSAEAEPVVRRLGEALPGTDAASLLAVPFGAGSELLGALVLSRHDPARPWSEAEIAAAEALAEDIARGLQHARLYEKEERLVRDLQSLDQAKTSFVASSSHDLRTPLTSIAGYAEMLADGDAGPLPPTQAKMIDAIFRNTRRLQALIEDMLTISTIELGAFTSRLRPIDVTELVPQAVDAIRPSAAESGLTLEAGSPDGELVVDGDREQLDRVLLNLLSNAVKYTPRGGRVTLTAARENDVALLIVADTGMGIPAADQRSLFTRFFRASNAVAQQIPGSGLGLNIVQTVVSNHHGKVELTSEEGHGTIVRIRIPLLADGPGVRDRADAGHVAGYQAGPPAQARDRAA
jgi:two-component system phosphate regulon sensor histidine kinase PhoR